MKRAVIVLVAIFLLLSIASAALISTPNPTSLAARPGSFDAALTVTPSDANTYSTPVMIWVGGTGAVTVTPASGGADVVFSAVPVATLLPLRVVAVKATGTTATLMIALY